MKQTRKKHSAAFKAKVALNTSESYLLAECMHLKAFHVLRTNSVVRRTDITVPDSSNSQSYSFYCALRLKFSITYNMILYII